MPYTKNGTASSPLLFGGLGLFLLLIVIIAITSGCFYVIEPGYRGVAVTLGRADPAFRPAGLGFKVPFITQVHSVRVQVESGEVAAECFSSDLQQVNADITINYHVEEGQVVKLYTQYQANLLDAIIGPRAQEALKERTATRTAEQIVKDREQVKEESLAALRDKVRGIVVIDDLVVKNLTLSHELEQAIEAKMVQQQQADQAKFSQDQSKTEADTAVIVAEGKAKAIAIEGEALAKTPQLVSLKIVEKWDGHSPMYVGGTGGATMLLPAVEPAK